MPGFTKALVRRPCRSMVRGLSSSGLGPPDVGRALEQHAAYIAALRDCGLQVTVLDADEAYPDSVFVEDTAVVCPEAAVIDRPGAASRQGEERSVAAALAGFFPRLDAIAAPGTLEGGDVMRADGRFFVGLSGRTNREGARQLAALLVPHGYEVLTVALGALLHLKTGVSYLEEGRLLAAGELAHDPGFSRFRVIPVPAGEEYAANSLWVNGRVLVAAGFPATRRAVEAAGCETLVLDVSEFRKLDGGLSCLSLRW
jgi:dimethylargininase